MVAGDVLWVVSRPVSFNMLAFLSVVCSFVVRFVRRYNRSDPPQERSPLQIACGRAGTARTDWQYGVRRQTQTHMTPAAVPGVRANHSRTSKLIHASMHAVQL